LAAAVLQGGLQGDSRLVMWGQQSCEVVTAVFKSGVDGIVKCWRALGMWRLPV